MKLADFVEKDRALVRKFKLSDFAGECTGVRTLLVPEQFVFNQCRWNGGAVHGYEGLVTTRTQLVYRA